MLSGDDTTNWNDAGPCPACGDTDCWLGCPEAEADDDMSCGCDYCNLVGQPCWRVRSAYRYAANMAAPLNLSAEGEAALVELLNGTSTTNDGDQ